MVAEPRTWVDVEAAVRTWARANVPLAGTRVFFGFSNDAPLPQIALFRVGGTDDNCLIQFDVWAATKAQAAQAAAQLCTAADNLSHYVSGGVLLHGALVESARWQPDEESNAPRYIVDVTFFATASA